MLGNKEVPFTAESLTQEELNLFSQAIQNSRNRLVSRNEAINNAKSYSDLPLDVREKFSTSRYLPKDFYQWTEEEKANPVKTTKIKNKMYQDALDKSFMDAKKFAEQTDKDLSAGYGYVNYDDYKGLPENMQYILGRFQYQILPNGQVKITDKYEFSNERNKEFIEKSKGMSPLEKMSVLSSQVMSGIKQDGVPWYQPAADVLGAMFMGNKGTPVDILYTPQQPIDNTGLEPSIR